MYTALHQWFDMGDYYALISGFALILTAILNPAYIAGRRGADRLDPRENGRVGPAGPAGRGTTEVEGATAGAREEVARHV